MNENSIIKASIFAIDRLRMGTDEHGVTTLVCYMHAETAHGNVEDQDNQIIDS